MTVQSTRAQRVSAPTGSVEFDADVLVLGGGPAGTWAAISAAEQGARVVLADKGFCGTSGATAAAGTGVWYVDPEPALREAAMANREKLGGHLQDRRWMARVLDRTYEQSNRLADWGYPYPVDDNGKSQRNSLQGPEYMRLMRKRTKQAGVTILDHSPALELLVDEDGSVAGASGLRRQKHDRWTVRARAVVIATGGCAFLSKTLGSNVLTGDGYLMAAEAGAEFSSMEFSNPYAISAAFGSVTKTLFYGWATFTYEDGSVVPGAASKGGRSAIARALTQGQVYARLDKADGDVQRQMRVSQPNFFLPFDRTGIDPFTDRFSDHLAARRHGAGHRWASDRRRQLRDHRARALCGGRRGDARADLRRLYRRRQPQRRLGDLFRHVCRAGGRRLCASCRSHARPQAVIRRNRRASPARRATVQAGRTRLGGSERGLSLRAELFSRGGSAGRLTRAARCALGRSLEGGCGHR